jgi:hypothetical protein
MLKERICARIAVSGPYGATAAELDWIVPDPVLREQLLDDLINDERITISAYEDDPEESAYRYGLPVFVLVAADGSAIYVQRLPGTKYR